VALGAGSYDITIGDGVLGGIAEALASACPAATYAVIADSTVAGLFAEQLARDVSVYRPCHVITFPAGEWNKSIEEWSGVIDRMIAAGIGRDGAVIALGGGVTGDLAGFAAATYLRGIPYVQVPTTLLAMIDSSIGGKTGIDTAHGKNLVGAFHQPKAVLADVSTLTGLPPLHLSSGMAEALKHGAIADADYFRWIGERQEAIRSRDAATLVELVRRSVEIKAGVVSEDERESGMRAVLNFGHTIGHAVETVGGYQSLHGEAVAIGMVAEARLGARLGATDREVEVSLVAAAEAFNLPTRIPDYPAEDLLDVMKRDKKTRAGTVRFALPQRIGTMAQSKPEDWTIEASESSILEVLRLMQ